MKLQVFGAALAVRGLDVLGPDAAAALHRAMLGERRMWVNASTGGRDDYRRAQLLYTPVDEAQAVVLAVREHLPRLCDALGIERFTARREELQMTAHGDGDFYRVHTDDQGEDVAARVLSYLYYFHATPKPFQGGELVIHADPSVTIEPICDSLVVFPSRLEHEVRPVHVASGALEDGRFTVNGWLWR